MLLSLCTDSSHADEREGYSSDSALAQLLTKYAAVAPPSRGASATAHAAASSSVSASRDSRTLQLLHGELSSISTSLRAIANVIAAGGSRAKVKESLELLLSGKPGESEEGQSHSVHF